MRLNFVGSKGPTQSKMNPQFWGESYVSYVAIPG